MTDLRPLLQELLTDIETAVRTAMVSKDPSLAGSDLVESVEVRVDSDKSLSVWVNDYYDFVNSGRRRGAGKIPITALINWIKEKNVGTGKLTVNQLAFAIQTSIFKAGIQGKFFDVAVDETVDEIINITLDKDVLDLLTVELDLQFKD